MSKEFELEKRIARILATQYWAGTQEKRRKVAGMKRSEYIAKSLLNWIPAARGIITLVKKEIKNNGRRTSIRAL
jgi:hypothetical protein